MYLATFEHNGKITWGAVDRERGLVFTKDEVFGEDAPETIIEYIKLKGLRIIRMP